MASIIQIRRDTAANWTATNPTLAQGEIGIETDTLKAKVGTGATAWTGLSYWINMSGVAYLATAETFTASQRGTVTTDNDGSFDMNVTNNFKCTPTAGFTLTFTNITAGQSGMVLLVNGSNYAIAAAATTKVGTTTLATISVTGTYLLSYFSDGTNVYLVNSGALA